MASNELKVVSFKLSKPKKYFNFNLKHLSLNLNNMVEIIPKPAAKASPWQNIIFYFLIGFILMVVLGYFILDFYLIDNAEKILKAKEATLAEEKTAEEIGLEKELSDYEKKTKDFSILINQHLFFSKAFEFIEKNTHPKVWFSQLDLSPKEGQVNLSGETEGFVTLHQQAQIFKADPLVKGLNLIKIAIGKEGRIDFDLSLTLDPDLFK